MYAMLCTRLDICFIVGMVSRYQSIQDQNIGQLSNIYLSTLEKQRIIYLCSRVMSYYLEDTHIQTFNLITILLVLPLVMYLFLVV